MKRSARMAAPQVSRIIWAVDPFAPEIGARQALQAVLARFAQLGASEIIPVYVARTRLDLALDPLDPEWEDRLTRDAEARIARIAAGMDLPAIRPPRVFRSLDATPRTAVDLLLDYAVSARADLIVAQTHARKGFPRLFLGSFAETLILRSPIPVLVLNPYVVPQGGFRNILFPTDFDPHSLPLFKRAIALARQNRGRVTLFHAIPYPIEPYSTANLALSSRYAALARDYVERELKGARRRARRWRELAAREGVRLDLVIESEGGSIWELMLGVARRHRVSLIALEAERGSWESALFGSVTRNLARLADCPVLVLRSHAAAAALKSRRRAA